ncbi:MAG: hypothetical protein A2Z14_12030 [Chloroflexi bacterium RBG_16_48_8]|nr:MAG: hypothetical protein A2Z14_12030 [Chloroflexi bacterium RBG_16_48_8]
MKNRILITAGSISLTATLRENETAKAIFEALPIESHANRWGDEIYFSIPVQLDEAEDARQEMHVGELGYWPVGTAFCIFFGRTPVSRTDEPRAYSNVNPFGQVDGEATRFRSVKDGERIEITRL